ncbi:SAR2788 family putative toxin [Lysinibacillus sp. NPDC093712]|uniref:SAR2788 family putative toxin n=1 Tax=Lysinibacillus sp. NPDC093712 TaxID=3390579 RepID=UPI003D02D679
MKKVFSVLLVLSLLFTILPRDISVIAYDDTHNKIDLNKAESEIEEKHNFQLSDKLPVNLKEDNENRLKLETNLLEEDLKINAELEINKNNHDIIVFGDVTDENGQITTYKYNVILHAVKEDVFIATLVDTITGEEYLLNSTKLEASATPLIPLIIGIVVKKAVKEAIKKYGKTAVKEAILSQLKWPKTISGRDLIKMLEKVGFEQVRQKGSHVTMKGPNGNTFTVPLHKELAKGTYNSIKKSVEKAIVPD